MNAGRGRRDPVASSIQDFLFHETADGHGGVVIEDGDDGVRVEFENHSAQGGSFDEAMLRLGRGLLEDERFQKPITEILHRHLGMGTPPPLWWFIN